MKNDSIFNKPIYLFKDGCYKVYYINYIPIRDMFIRTDKEGFHVSLFSDLSINDDLNFKFAVYRVEGEKRIKSGGKVASKFFLISNKKFLFSKKWKENYRPLIYIHSEDEKIDNRYSNIHRILLCICSDNGMKEELSSLGLLDVKEQIKSLLLG